MTISEKIQQYQKVWRLVLPHLSEPQPEDAVRWCAYPTEIVETAILRAGQRFAPPKVGPSFQPLQAFKFVTATSRSLTMKQQHTEAA